MRTDRQKETTVHQFLWEIQLEILYSRVWWYVVLLPATWYAVVFWDCKKRQATPMLSIRGCSAYWVSPGHPWALWTPTEHREVVYGHSGCQQTLPAILIVRHQFPHCTISQVNSETHKWKNRLCLHWRCAEGLGVQRKVQENLHKSLILLGVRIRGDARIHHGEMAGRAVVAPGGGRLA